jgi:hypothetical protein
MRFGDVAAKALDRRGVDRSVFAGLALVILLFTGHRSEAQTSTASHLGVYGETSTYCGTGGITQNASAIPWIGCFSLSAGHSATGTFSNQKVEVTVDAAGQETFMVNGVAITTSQRATNLPYVHPSGGGYSICPDTAPDNCPTHIDVFSRNADRSVLFMVAECFPPPLYRKCVLTQQNWDFEQSHQASNQRQENLY